MQNRNTSSEILFFYYHFLAEQISGSDPDPAHFMEDTDSFQCWSQDLFHRQIWVHGFGST